MVVGLGTGSTVFYLLTELGRRVREEGLRITGVPTSAATAKLAGQYGIALASGIPPMDLALDGADEVEAGIAAALNHDGPVLVDAVVNRTELAMPPAVTLEMAKGFTLYMVRAVMSGRGDELIDLARTNLWR